MISTQTQELQSKTKYYNLIGYLGIVTITINYILHITNDNCTVS